MPPLNLLSLSEASISDTIQTVKNIFRIHEANDIPTGLRSNGTPTTSYVGLGGPATLPDSGLPLLRSPLGNQPASRYSADYGLTAGQIKLGEMEIPLGPTNVGHVAAYKQDMERKDLAGLGINYPGASDDGMTLLTCRATISKPLTGLTRQELYDLIFHVESYSVALQQSNFGKVVTATALQLPFTPKGTLVFSDFPTGFGVQAYNVILLTGDGSHLKWSSTFTDPQTGEVKSFNDYAKNINGLVPFGHIAVDTAGAWTFSDNGENIDISYANALPSYVDWLTTDKNLMGVINGLFGDLFSKMGAVYVAVKANMGGASDAPRKYVIQYYNKNESVAENLTRMGILNH